jgi:hypothetical protein
VTAGLFIVTDEVTGGPSNQLLPNSQGLLDFTGPDFTGPDAVGR